VIERERERESERERDTGAFVLLFFIGVYRTGGMNDYE
jgi:hypothetical protein